MSDFRPTPAGSDRVRDTLTELRVDADATALADPAHVRHRGQARTRHQAVAGLAAAVVVVVIGAGAVFGIGGTDKAQTQLPANPTPTPSQSAVTPAADPFVQTADIGVVGAYGQLQRSPDAFHYQAKLVCMRGPSSWGGDRAQSQLFFSDLDATFYEHVLHYADANAAAAGVQTVLSQLASCEIDKQHPKRITQRGPEPVAGSAGSTRASWLSSAQQDSEIYYYELGIKQAENVVVVLEWSSMGNPEGKHGWVWTPDRLDLAAQRAVG